MCGNLLFSLGLVVNLRQTIKNNVYFTILFTVFSPLPCRTNTAFKLVMWFSSQATEYLMFEAELSMSAQRIAFRFKTDIQGYDEFSEPQKLQFQSKISK